MPTKVWKKFEAARAALCDTLIERENEIDLTLTGLVAKENVLLVGPPGVAKSRLLDAVLQWYDCPSFSVLLTKFTDVNEIMGPYSLVELAAGKYVRMTAGKLPEAVVFFGDEIFKASSAILNTMLRILNEGVVQGPDGRWLKAPLQLCVAGSNEWPSDENGFKELNALFDRFLLRRTVQPIRTRAGEERLLDFAGVSGGFMPAFAEKITVPEVEEAQRDALAVTWSSDAQEAAREIIKTLKVEGILPSDRRKYKSVGVVRAYAWLAGADEVQPEHLEIWSACLWDDPGEQPAKAASVIAKIANPTGMRINGMLLTCEEILAATNHRDMYQASASCLKLDDLAATLKSMGKDPRAVRAMKYVQAAASDLRIKSLS